MNYTEETKKFMENYYQTQKQRFLKWLEDTKEYAENDDWVMAMLSLGYAVNYAGQSQSLVEYARPTKEKKEDWPIPNYPPLR